MALCLANTVMAKEYTGGKWKYDKYNEDIYKDFYIKKKVKHNIMSMLARIIIKINIGWV